MTPVSRRKWEGEDGGVGDMVGGCGGGGGDGFLAGFRDAGNEKWNDP